MPGTELAVNSRPGDVNAHEGVYIAIRDAFDAMERQLEKFKEQKRGDVKSHEKPLQGRIAEIDHDQGFGHIVAADGRFVYFHPHSVVNKSFDDLKTGDPVELFVDYEESEKGPQASTVRAISTVGVIDKPD